MLWELPTARPSAGVVAARPRGVRLRRFAAIGGSACMSRRLFALPGALAWMGLGTPAANVPPPTTISSVSPGKSSGTFAAAAPLCPSGTWVDDSVVGGGAFHSGVVNYNALTVRETLSCANGSGTVTILFHPQFTPATPVN